MYSILYNDNQPPQNVPKTSPKNRNFPHFLSSQKKNLLLPCLLPTFPSSSSAGVHLSPEEGVLSKCLCFFPSGNFIPFRVGGVTHPFFSSLPRFLAVFFFFLTSTYQESTPVTQNMQMRIEGIFQSAFFARVCATTTK